jgi:hypothetical protein
MTTITSLILAIAISFLIIAIRCHNCAFCYHFLFFFYYYSTFSSYSDTSCYYAPFSLSVPNTHAEAKLVKRTLFVFLFLVRPAIDVSFSR